MHGGGFIAKHSSFLICEGCFRKAFGLLPRIFRDALGPPILVGVATPPVGCRMPGCHGEGIELPTSLPASDAVKKITKYISKIEKYFHILNKILCAYVKIVKFSPSRAK